MERYVVRNGIHCQVFEHGWNYKEWQSTATGQWEHKLWPRLLYVPLGDIDDPDVLADPPVDQTGTVYEQEQLEKQRLQALEKSARRAKQGCAHKIKEAGFSSLLTCTYRENMVDFDRVRADWAAMMRKLAACLPNFAAVFAFEQQDRGAWHIHAAIHKLPVFLWVSYGRGRSHRKVMVRSWDYIRRCWRGIVGKDNGNIDVDGHRRNRRAKRGGHLAAESLARLAGYVSKYLTKDHASGPPGRNRWGSTQGIKPPKAAVRQLPPMPMIDAIVLAFHCPAGNRIVQHRMGQFGKFWMLYTEPDPEHGNLPVADPLLVA